ncbi:ABC transporter substrate-binding protein [Paraburkholderia sp. Ac-20342]|uniref:ABC transporter substrate-binding protein n=1 Tax=Paraburkholderia sp. Ac-20342 TaxID=2703889 RepID=UPI00197D074E|nr:ABC transporter substrate-binding protein [Paraburkholderia sp. Ac-20342]MBN3849306.1 ABC transporter substrate-binding protein [Paraburkholderia sp. Ac-20342]
MTRLIRAFTAAALCVAAAAGAPAFAQPLQKIVLRTDYKFNGYVAPFALAVQNGYYKQAGLDVSIQQGQGSGTTVQTVASGADDFGLADASIVVLAVTAQNIGVKLVSVYTQTGTMGLIYRANAGFTGDLKQLQHKAVISSSGTADLRMLSPALASAGMNTDDVQLQIVDSNARVPMFLKTNGAYLTGFATGDLLRIRSRMPDAKYMPYAKYGVVAYGTGLIASDDMLQKHPDLVRKFVDASRKGWEAAVKDPQAAVDASLKLYPDLSREFVQGGLKIALAEQLHTAATAAHPIGWTDEGDWKKMLDVLAKYAGVHDPKAPAAYYTNQFIAQ